MSHEFDIGDSLSELERRLFLAIREVGPVTVAEIVDRLAAGGRPLAYTTVMTVMTRLWEKSFLVRQRQGKAYHYQARDQLEIAGQLGARAVRLAIERYGQGALVGLVQTLTPEQRLLVARLLRSDAAEEPNEKGDI
ncbi:MAG: BlaI/MecI/CopY family transcriptional regulator [Tepidiformaceae bacterium]